MLSASMATEAVAAGSAFVQASKEQSYKASVQDAAPAKRLAGRRREEGPELVLVRQLSASAVRPQLVSQSSLPAVEHDAPTKPSQPPAKAAKAPSAADVEAAAAAAAHTAMLNRYRAEWQVTKQDSFWSRLYKHLEWRAFWIGHTCAISVLDYEERVMLSLLYLAMLGLLVGEGCRRLLGGLQGLW